MKKGSTTKRNPNVRRSFSERLYADRKAPDGGIANGWRKVKKGGRVKIGGAWYAHESLKAIVGELVNVQIGEYWGSYVLVSRGVIGCMEHFCKAE